MKVVKGDFSFDIDAKTLEVALTRMSNITSYSSSDTDKQNIFVSDGKTLYLVGLAQDITAYISVCSEVKGSGYASFPIDVVQGLVKKRSGKFRIESDQSELKIRSNSTSYKLTITLLSVGDDVLSDIKEIEPTEMKGTKISEGTISSLRKYVKTASLKEAVFGSPLPVYIDSRKDQLRVISYDNYHALILIVPRKEETTFRLAVTGTTYGVIEKFISDHVVSFSVEKYLNLVGENSSFYASLPPIQSKDEDYDSAMNYYKSLKNPKVKFYINGNSFKVIENMATLRSAAADAASTKYSFSTKIGVVKREIEKTVDGVKKKKIEKAEGPVLEVTYSTSNGKASEEIPLLMPEGYEDTWKKVSFVISNKILENIVFPFASYSSVEFCVYERCVTLCAELTSQKLVALGTLDS